MQEYNSSKIKFLQLCLVTHRQDRSFEEYLKLVESAVLGGITCVQLREKNATEEELSEFALALLKLLKIYSVPLIINDRVDICKKVKAQGVHLGQSDMHPDQARSILGSNAIIGLSIENFSQLNEANKLNSITYLSASSLFLTKSKSDCKTIWGIRKLEKFCRLAKYPVIAIGGINKFNLHSALGSGIQGIAVISAIQEATRPDIAAKELYNRIFNYFEERTYDTRTDK